MTNELIHQAARLMQEQAAAYSRLDAASQHLSATLVGGDPTRIESLTRAGEAELLRMRSRLVQIVSTLTAFAEARSRQAGAEAIPPEARAEFEAASQDLLRKARQFEATRRRASALAASGATFAAAAIEVYGVQPSTYRAPYARRGEGRPWA